MALKQSASVEKFITSWGPKTEENIADYRDNGYLHIQVGDTLRDRRYNVIKKLGAPSYPVGAAFRLFGLSRTKIASLIRRLSHTALTQHRTNRYSALKVFKSAGRDAETMKEEVKLLSPEDSVPAQEGLPITDFTRPTQPQSPETWTQDSGDGQWRPMPANEENAGISSLANVRDAGLAREIERADLGHTHMKPLARPGHDSHSSAGMFTNAQVKASGGTFVNVAHIYECDAPALGGGPAFPIAVVSLQVMSFAMRSHYPHCDRSFEPVPLLMPEPTSTANVALRFPLLYQEMRTIMGPLTLWLFIKMWIQGRTVELLYSPLNEYLCKTRVYTFYTVSLNGTIYQVTASLVDATNLTVFVRLDKLANTSGLALPVEEYINGKLIALRA